MVNNPLLTEYFYTFYCILFFFSGAEQKISKISKKNSILLNKNSALFGSPLVNNFTRYLKINSISFLYYKEIYFALYLGNIYCINTLIFVIINIGVFF